MKISTCAREEVKTRNNQISWWRGSVRPRRVLLCPRRLWLRAPSMGLEWPRSFKLAWWMLLTIQWDRRAQDAITAGIFPPSLVVKNFVRKAFLSCSSNPELTVQELRDLIADPNKHPPSRPAAPLWQCGLCGLCSRWKRLLPLCCQTSLSARLSCSLRSKPEVGIHIKLFYFNFYVEFYFI